MNRVDGKVEVGLYHIDGVMFARYSHNALIHLKFSVLGPGCSAYLSDRSLTQHSDLHNVLQILYGSWI